MTALDGGLGAKVSPGGKPSCVHGGSSRGCRVDNTMMPILVESVNVRFMNKGVEGRRVGMSNHGGLFSAGGVGCHAGVTSFMETSDGRLRHPVGHVECFD